MSQLTVGLQLRQVDVNSPQRLVRIPCEVSQRAVGTLVNDLEIAGELNCVCVSVDVADVKHPLLARRLVRPFGHVWIVDRLRRIEARQQRSAIGHADVRGGVRGSAVDGADHLDVAARDHLAGPGGLIRAHVAALDGGKVSVIGMEFPTRDDHLGAGPHRRGSARHNLRALDFLRRALQLKLRCAAPAAAAVHAPLRGARRSVHQRGHDECARGHADRGVASGGIVAAVERCP